MSISRADVQHVAILAHIHLTEDETERMQSDMNRILEYAKQLHTVDGTAEGDRKEDADKIPLRADEVQTWLEPDEATADAPGAENNLFRVPPVISGDLE